MSDTVKNAVYSSFGRGIFDDSDEMLSAALDAVEDLGLVEEDEVTETTLGFILADAYRSALRNEWEGYDVSLPLDPVAAVYHFAEDVASQEISAYGIDLDLAVNEDGADTAFCKLSDQEIKALKASLDILDDQDLYELSMDNCAKVMFLKLRTFWLTPMPAIWTGMRL